MFCKFFKFRSIILVSFFTLSSFFSELKVYSEKNIELNASFLFSDEFNAKAALLQSEDGLKVLSEEALEQYLLPDNHPLQPILKKLFKNSRIFGTVRQMKNQGFTFFDHYSRKLLVCTHPLLENQYVIKKFVNSVPDSTQLEGYLRRLEGCKKVSEYLEHNQCTHIVVSKKYLYELPSNVSNFVVQKKSYLLIAQKFDLCNEKETKEKYQQISKEALAELCLFLLEFRGLDSNLDNLPFTKEGKIAFIDLDKWERKRDTYMLRIMEELSEENKEYVNAFTPKDP